MDAALSPAAVASLGFHLQFPATCVRSERFKGERKGEHGGARGEGAPPIRVVLNVTKE